MFVTNSNKVGWSWLEQLQKPIIIPQSENLYLSLYLMAEIAIHPTKWQKSRPILMPELKNCDPSSERHFRTRHFLGVNPPGVMTEEISLKKLESELWQAVSSWKMYHLKLNIKWKDEPMNRPISLSSIFMEVSSVSPRVPPPGQLRSGMIFFLRNPLPSGTNYCLISLGVGVGQWVGALFMRRFSFCLSKMVACLSNWLKINTVEMREDFLRKFCSCVCYLQT